VKPHAKNANTFETPCRQILFNISTQKKIHKPSLTKIKMPTFLVCEQIDAGVGFVSNEESQYLLMMIVVRFSPVEEFVRVVLDKHTGLLVDVTVRKIAQQTGMWVDNRCWTEENN
jgi:hypothetical protein